ncbi:MAG: ABC transporter ATP-binding protein [Rhodospirillales bacterium]
MTALLEIENLTTCFETEAGRIQAVDGVSYGLGEGEVLGVVGESGSGKSVHALSIMRLLPSPPGRILGGRVLYRGQDLLTLTDAQMRRVRGKEIAMIFQDPIASLNPVYSIGFQLAETLRVHLGMTGGALRRRSVELLDLVGIPDPRLRLRSYPHELSGGMRQRVMIAMALACHPKLLIADEPTTALDVTIQAQIVELIKELRRELQLTVIWISHDLGIVAGLADRVNVMYAGRLIESGPVREIYRQPHHPYTQGLLRSVPRLDRPSSGTLASIPGRPPNLAGPGTGCPFAPRCGLADSRCATEMPPPALPQTSTRQVRCWHWRDVGRDVGRGGAGDG